MASAIDIRQLCPVLSDKANKGLDRLLSSDDIAIYTLATMLILAIIGNATQYVVGNYRQGKDFDRYVFMAKALSGLEGALDEIKALFSVIIQMSKGKDNVASDKKPTE